MVLAWLISGVLVYVLALHYANVSYDRALIDALHALERMMRSEARYEALNPQTRILFEVDSEDPNYYTIRSLHHGTLASNLELPLPDAAADARREAAHRIADARRAQPAHGLARGRRPRIRATSSSCRSRRRCASATRSRARSWSACCRSCSA